MRPAVSLSLSPSLTMALPEAIPVRYAEEEAGYVTFRPIVRQTFGLQDLLGMVLSVTGKEPARVRQILRSGSVSFHLYRYWWDGFEVQEEELQALLARFPDPDPARPFRPEACTVAIVESGDSPPRHGLELARAGVARRTLLRRRSFWDALLAAGASGPLAYHGYSYSHRADLYRLALTEASRAALAAAAKSLAPRNLRGDLRALDQAAQIVFVCPRASV
jgi:hypothetical protein